MGVKIFHQLGFREKWNFDSYTKDGVGEGFIISPRSMDADKVTELIDDFKKISIFDPQIVNPHEMAKNVRTYDFYPLSLMTGEFNTHSFSTYCEKFAEECANFQIGHKFQYIVTPTRFLDDVPPVEDFIEYQTELFINPFMKIIKEKDVNTDIILQLYLNSHILKNKEYRSDLLDWITGLNSIQGIYLITEIIPRNKQIEDPLLLIALLEFIDALKQNELIVILGYSNTELLLYTLADPSVLTLGSYENLRIFNSSMFKNLNAEKTVRSPNPRVYAPQLLDWIEYPYVQLINESYPEKMKLFGNNEYLNIMLKPDYNWSSQKPDPYKHYFFEMDKQIKTINSLEEKEKFHYINSIIDSAMKELTEIEQLGIYLGQTGSHLPKWKTAAFQFAKEKGWL